MTVTLAQDAASAAQRAENLRAQLRDVQAKETELQSRVQQLEEALRPENIERATAGAGSTRPEELRDQRRRQLENEKARVRAQLDQLAASRTRLESAITTAEAEAYRQSANINTASSQPSADTSSTQAAPTIEKARPRPRPQRLRRHRRPRTSRQRQ